MKTPKIFHWPLYILARIVFSKRELGMIEKDSTLKKKIIAFKCSLERNNLLELSILGVVVIFAYLILRMVSVYIGK